MLCARDIHLQHRYQPEDILTPEQSDKLIKTHELVMKRFGYLSESGQLRGI